MMPAGNTLEEKKGNGQHKMEKKKGEFCQASSIHKLIIDIYRYLVLINRAGGLYGMFIIWPNKNNLIRLM